MRGTWVAQNQSVKTPAHNRGLGHDLLVCEIEPQVRLCADSIQLAWDSVSLSLSLKLKTNKLKKEKVGAPGWLSWLSGRLRLRS